MPLRLRERTCFFKHERRLGTSIRSSAALSRIAVIQIATSQIFRSKENRMAIAAIIMIGLMLMTITITAGIVVARKNENEHQRELLILRQQYEIEQRQLRSS